MTLARLGVWLLCCVCGMAQVPVKNGLRATRLFGGSPIMQQVLATVERMENVGGAAGDNGCALGAYQFHQRTWLHVSQMRKAQGLPTVAWRTGAVNSYWAKIYALDYLCWLADQLDSELGWFSEQALYAAWNTGLTRVLRVGGRLSALSSAAKERCLRLDPKQYTRRLTKSIAP